MLRIQSKIRLREGQTIWIYPFNDIHYNTEECDRAKFQRYIQSGVDHLKDGDLLYGIGLGDYNDYQSPSERAADVAVKGGYGKHETTLKEFDKLIEAQTLAFAEVMNPWKHHIGGLQEGHPFGCYSAFFRKTIVAHQTLSTWLIYLLLPMWASWAFIILIWATAFTFVSWGLMATVALVRWVRGLLSGSE